jgi:hypothetical protein
MDLKKFASLSITEASPAYQHVLVRQTRGAAERHEVRCLRELDGRCSTSAASRAARIYIHTFTRRVS